MKNQPVWKTQPIFISSTFTDLMEERDMLRDVIFPELEERLKERRVRLEPIDLRWGVETTSETEQKKKELMVLKVCLDEIDRCKPFFIGIIGDRYGWIPPAERMAEAEKEKGFITSLTNKSVTALEIEYGALSNEEQLKRSFFFFRESLPYHKMPEEKRCEFADIYNKEFDRDEAESRLKNFKKLIISKVGQKNVFSYKADWKNGNVCGLEEFKEKVLSRLWKELDEQTKELEDLRPKTWQEEEKKYFEDFIEDRTISFAGRTDIIDDLIDFINSNSVDDKFGLCLVGEAGSGKSALFAQVYKTLKKQKDDIMLLGHAAGISPRSDSVINMLILWIEELAQELKINIRKDIERSPKIENLRKLFEELLTKTSNNKKVVLLVDALNQFERSIQTKYVNWLPDSKLLNVKFLFTTIEGEESENLSKRGDIEIRKLNPINRADANKIVDIICKRYHKKLNKEAIIILLNKIKDDNSFAYNNPLWLTMAVDEFILLDSDDFDRMKGLEGTPEEKLKKLLLLTAKELPTDLSEMYNYVLKRSEKFGKDFVDNIISYIGISRYGLRESDFKGLLTFYSNESWDNLNFASLRRYLRSHLVQKGELQLFDFKHSQFRASIKKGLISKSEKTIQLHKNLAEHLEKIQDDDPLYETEIMYHHINSDGADLAAKYLAKESLSENQLHAVCQIFKDFLLGSSDYPPEPLKWICNNIVLNRQLSDDQIIRLCQRMSHRVLVYLTNSLKTDIRIEIAYAIVHRLKELEGSKVDAAFYVNVYSHTYRILGDMQNDLGDFNSALNSYLLSLEKSEYLYYFSLVPENGMNTETAAINFSTAHTCASEQYKRLNKPQKAEEHFNESERINNTLLSRNPESIPLRYDSAVQLLKQGALLHLQGSLNTALEKYYEALTLLSNLTKNEQYKININSALSEAYDRIGGIKLSIGEVKKSIDFFNKALALREENYRNDPSSVLAINNLLVTYLHAGEAYLKLDNFESAKICFQKAEKKSDELVNINNQNIDYERAKNMVIERWVEYCENLENYSIEKHEHYLNELVEKCKISYNKVPDSEELQNDYSRALRKKAFLYADNGDNTKAIQYLNEALDLYKSIIPVTNHYKEEIFVLLNSLVEIYKRTREFNKAQACIENKIDICEYILQSDPENKAYQEKLKRANIELNEFILLIIQLYNHFAKTQPINKHEIQRDYEKKVEFLKKREVIIPKDYLIHF